MFVATVLAGSPASAGGINARDEILAVDGLRVDADQWERQLEARRPGDRARILVARLGRLRTHSVTFGSRPAKPPKVARVPKPTRAQRAVYSSWLKSPWPR
jgi:predicted metalloprotease with PDZ domain